MNQTGEIFASTGRALESSDTVSQLQKDLVTNGFLIFREVLTPDQVENLRLVIREHLKSGGRYNYGGKFQLHAMYEVDEVAKLLTSDKILNHLKKITHPIDVVLTGECDLMINTTSAWHNDVPHHPACFDGSIFSDETFRVYKIAFYLQDQEEHSPATLKVRPRSHLKSRGHIMPEVNLAVRAGDAIVFDVRIEHAGQMPTLFDRGMRRLFEKIGPRLRLDVQKAFTSTRSIVRRITGKRDRVAVFMTFGPSEPWTFSYADEGRMRHPGVRGRLSPDVLKQLALNNVAPPLIGNLP